MTDATRYLASAPYLDGRFAGAVIEHVVEDEHRAIAPSWDIDLGPVVRHCFRARRLQLARDATIAGLLLLGVWVSAPLTISWLLLGCAVVAARSSGVQRLAPVPRTYLLSSLVIAAFFVFCCGSFWQQFQQNGAAGDPFSGDPGDTLGLPAGATPEALAGLAAIGLAAFGVLFGFRVKIYTVLTTELAPGRGGPYPRLGSERVARRVAAVAAAQYGNIGYQDRTPFLGAGVITRMWSFALRLRPAGGGTAPDAPDTPPSRSRAAGHREPAGEWPVALPLAELGPAINRRVQEVVKRMGGEHLPPGVRVPNLYLAPFLVANSALAREDPLLEPHTQVPYPAAYPEAVEAIMRHPQAGIRYYQRVVVGGPGKPVRTATGLPVLPAQHLPITISAFIHVAVEGGRLYTEFVATVMPPVQARYTLADGLRPERVLVWALRDTLRGLPADSTAAGWRALRSAWRIVTTRWRMNQAQQASQDMRVYDYGARVSVRQLGAEPKLDNYLHALDDEKYVKLVERAVVEAVAECLDEHGYDTAEFRERANHVQNVNIYGGQQAFGGNPTFHQHHQAAKSGAA